MGILRGPPLDPLGQRTLFLGLVAAFVVYGIGLASAAIVGGTQGLFVANVLTFVSLLLALGWFIAVRRGFRLGRKSRAERRRSEREKPRTPFRR